MKKLLRYKISMGLPNQPKTMPEPDPVQVLGHQHQPACSPSHAPSRAILEQRQHNYHSHAARSWSQQKPTPKIQRVGEFGKLGKAMRQCQNPALTHIVLLNDTKVSVDVDAPYCSNWVLGDAPNRFSLLPSLRNSPWNTPPRPLVCCRK